MQELTAHLSSTKFERLVSVITRGGYLVYILENYNMNVKCLYTLTALHFHLMA